MAAREHQDQRVVLAADQLRAAQRPRSGELLAAAAGIVAAVGVSQPPGRHPDQPAERVLGLTFGWPGGCGCDQRLLYCVLSGSEIAVAPDEDAEYLRREVAPQVLRGRGGRPRDGSG